MQDLFSAKEAALSPLADRMRPRTLDEFIGQGHIVGPGRLLRRAIEADRMTSSIFYGPPGCGKTTLASIIANTTHSAFVQLNAVTSGVADVRKSQGSAGQAQPVWAGDIPAAGRMPQMEQIAERQHPARHRARRGALHRLDDGKPARVHDPGHREPMPDFPVLPLGEADVMLAMRRALADKERGFGSMCVQMDDDAMRHIARIANGDVRSALGALELAVLTNRTGRERRDSRNHGGRRRIHPETGHPLR